MPAAITQEGERRKRPIFRYLRIAFSVGCGAICLLVIALWVRSYWRWECLNSPNIATISNKGRVGVIWNYGMLWPYGLHEKFWRASSYDNDWFIQDIMGYLPNALPKSNVWGFGCYRAWHASNHRDFTVVMPHWFLVLVSLALSALPWLRWRFNLRTLLFGITVVAALLGAVVLAVR